MIKKLIMISFGKFKNHTIDFKNNINIITGDNESGKSTIMAFIEVMLYGCLNSFGNTKLQTRKKYMPWDQNVIQGELHLLFDKKLYIIKRKIGKTAKTDELIVINGLNGDVVDLKGKEPGEYFYEIDKSSFLKTAMIKQLSSQITKDNEDEIFNKLSNLSSIGEDDISYEKVLNYLINKRRNISSLKRKDSLISNIEETLFTFSSL